MIPSQHREPWNALIRGYSRLRLHLQFGPVRVHATGEAPAESVLLVGNHFSWWDGFFAQEVNRRFFKKRMHVMMLEEQLRPRMFLSYAGAFSIAPGKRSALNSLNYASQLLRDKGQLVVLFPQGELQPLYRFPLAFQQGWHRILKAEGVDAPLWFMATLPAFGDRPRAGVDIFIQAAPEAVRPHPEYITGAYNIFLQQCLQKLPLL
ncbi:MAG TPA: lysophospholipid acyltransferase family protein [Bacteroidales bacterium]|nr:lysophospholipid acyltransferase family protein [Bacteroidales bacterium]